MDRIVEALGPRRLDSLRPSEIRLWHVELKDEGYTDSYVYALHARLASWDVLRPRDVRVP